MAGTVTVNDGGTVAPGTSAGTLSTGSVTFNAGSTLAIEIGGLLQGTEYDFLNVTGQFAVAGLLDVVLLDGFMPAAADSFDLFDGTISGTFSEVSLPELDGNLTWNTDSLYTIGTIRVLQCREVVGARFLLGRGNRSPMVLSRTCGPLK